MMKKTATTNRSSSTTPNSTSLQSIRRGGVSSSNKNHNSGDFSQPSFKHQTPIRSSNIVVAGSNNRNMYQMAKQLQNSSKLSPVTDANSSNGVGRSTISPPKKRVSFPYPKFSRSEYQQQYMKEATGGSDDEELLSPNSSLQISRKDIEQTFRFFDVQKKNKLTPKDLKQRLKIFYPNMSNNEYKFLISDNNFTVDKLAEILSCNVMTNFDPFKEAFKIFDPNETGFIDLNVLTNIMTQLGYGAISDEDLQVLINTGDVDGDGRISLEDFKNMLR